MDGPSTTWDKIRRALGERSEQTSYDGPLKVSLPWWEFLACREAVGLHVQVAGWTLEADGDTRQQLLRAASHQSMYDQALSALPLTDEELDRRLREGGFTRPLTQEQRRNLKKMARMDAAAAFSVPGSGKTTEALAFYVLHGGEQNRLLVVAPRNAFAAWDEQLGLCFNHQSEGFVRLQGGAERINEIVSEGPPLRNLISYRQIATETVRDTISRMLATYPTLVFLDESHRMKKGLAGESGRAILSISHLPLAKMILSGTPVPNSIEDLVPQFDFLYPEVRASTESVTSQIQPVYTRTTKRELGLRDPVTTHIPIPLPPAHRRLYEAMRSDEARRLMGMRAKESMMLRSAGRSAMRLLQAVSNPALLTGVQGIPESLLSDAIQEQTATKMEYVSRRARELAMRDEKVVIWSSFVNNVEVLAGRLKDLGAEYVHGGVPTGEEADEDTRERKIKDFHDDATKMVLVANPAACAEGISLHEVCHTAIFLDRTFNAAHYLQAKDRIHRLGLSPLVTTRIEIVHAPDTVDDVVNRRLAVKIDRLSLVLNDPGIREEEVLGDPDDPDDVNLTLEDMQDYLRHLEAR